MSTTSGTRACHASTTAGRKFAAAVPDVHSTATGRREARARPSAKNAPERSSTCDQQRSPACPANASASGADRLPGEMQTSLTPAFARPAASTFGARKLRLGMAERDSTSHLDERREHGAQLETGLLEFVLPA